MDVAPVDMPVHGSPLRPEDELDELAASARARLAATGADWTWHVEAPWIHVGPAGADVPEQGWKLHVAATEASAPAVLDAALPVLLADGVTFKFAAALPYVRVLNSATAARESGGKFLTIYPRDDAQAVRLAEACHRATAGLDGPAILSDRPYRPGSLVHYRYGGFQGRPAIDADGMVVHLLRAPGGELVPDSRSASYQAPPWAADPFQPPAEALGTAASTPAPGSVLLNDRYLVRGAFRHSNKGGVYLAEDRRTGVLVVLKEGRPHVAADAAGDARDRIRHEARMLALVTGVRRAPGLVEVFEQQGHVFLVEEHLPCPSLRDVVDGAFHPPEPGLPAADVIALTARAAETMAAFHAAGVVLRDFNPNNLLVGPDDEFALVDFELAHPAGEASGPAAGTPGYASPEQLRGEPAGIADDYWSLGATIAHLATGADPYLPADVNHTWTDPDRLRLWVERQVEDGLVGAPIAEVVLGCMAPRPTDRWSPDAVLAALRGEGRRTAPGRGSGRRWTGVDKPARHHPRPAVDRLHEIHDDVIGWLLAGLGRGSAGHLWPAGPSGMSLDPVTVQAGASGVGLFLCQAAGAEEDGPRRAAIRQAIGTAADWVAHQVEGGPERPPGLYFGLSGVAWFLTEAALVLGRDDLARRANELALSLPLTVPNSDITHGTAGIGLGQLHQWIRSGDDRFLARAVVAAEHVLRAAFRPGHPDQPAVVWPVPASAPSRLAGTTSYGFAHGNAGIATFLLHAGAAAGEVAFTAAALEALDALLPFAVAVGGAAFWPAGPGDAAEDYWPHWCNGSSGIGTALVRAFAATGDQRYRQAAEGAAEAVLRERWRNSAVQCHGLAGDAELLLDLARFTGEGRFTEMAEVAADALALARRVDRGYAVFADDTGSRVCAGFGVGVAGVGAFISRLLAGGPRPLLLDELLPGRGPA
jgi:Lanthionine synthetase C-like protein/Protein kinase domain